MDKNPFLDLQKDFRNYYHLNEYLKESPYFRFLEPIELKLGDGKKCTFQYILFVDTISTIVQDPGFNLENPSEDGLLYGMKDGTVYEENKYFQENKDALTIEIYSDAVGGGGGAEGGGGRRRRMSYILNFNSVPDSYLPTTSSSRFSFASA